MKKIILLIIISFLLLGCAKEPQTKEVFKCPDGTTTNKECQIQVVDLTEYFKTKGIDLTGFSGTLSQLTFTGHTQDFENIRDRATDILLYEDLTRYNIQINTFYPSFRINLDNFEYMFDKYGNEWDRSERVQKTYLVKINHVFIEQS